MRSKTKQRLAFRNALCNLSSVVRQSSTTGGVRWLTRKLTNPEKTVAWTCSGTARERPLAVALHYFFSDRVLRSRARSGNGGAFHESRRDEGQGREGEGLHQGRGRRAARRPGARGRGARRARRRQAAGGIRQGQAEGRRSDARR